MFVKIATVREERNFELDEQGLEEVLRTAHRLDHKYDNPVEDLFCDDDTPEAVSGDLLLTCEKCGKEKAFTTASPISTYHCKNCGWNTPLRNIRPATLRCPCGNVAHYKTNSDERIIACFCGKCHRGSWLRLDKTKSYYEGPPAPARTRRYSTVAARGVSVGS